MTDAIKLAGVSKSFGSKLAVNELDLVIPSGALYGFIGPNGAGKTTTIRMIMSILFPDCGEVEVLGRGSALEAKDRIGYLPEERGVYKKMKVGAFLGYMARLKHRDGHADMKRVRHWLERVGLADVEKKKCEELSKGMLQKVQFIAAVIHEPELLILDEPFSGLDPVNMRLLRDLVLDESRRGATIIFSTHVMAQAEQICDDLVMINNGNKVLDDTLTNIRSQFDPRTILFEAFDSDAELAALEELACVQHVKRDGGQSEVTLATGSDPAQAMRDIVNTIVPSRIELHRPTLEDIFVQIVTESGDASVADLERLRAELRVEAAAEVVR